MPSGLLDPRPVGSLGDIGGSSKYGEMGEILQMLSIPGYVLCVWPLGKDVGKYTHFSEGNTLEESGSRICPLLVPTPQYWLLHDRIDQLNKLIKFVYLIDFIRYPLGSDCPA